MSYLNQPYSGNPVLSVTTDSGSATPTAGGVLSIVGSDDLVTSASGSTVTIGIDGFLNVSVGGSGAGSFTQYGVLVGNGASSFGVTTAGTTGQFLMAVTSSNPQWRDPYPFKWTEITGTSQTIAVNNAYISNNGSRVMFALPASSFVGDVFVIVGKGSGGWRITQAAGQKIFLGSSGGITTTGATGYLESNIQRDAVFLVCFVANTQWNAVQWTGTPVAV